MTMRPIGRSGAIRAEFATPAVCGDWTGDEFSITAWASPTGDPADIA